jgi:hypothetical protein
MVHIFSQAWVAMNFQNALYLSESIIDCTRRRGKYED